MYISPLDDLIRRLSSLPGMGPRSARRVALHLIERKDASLKPLIASLTKAHDTISTCDECGNLDHSNPCGLCRDHARDGQSICVIANVADLWAIERTRTFKGLYHVLGGILSAVDGVRVENLTIPHLIERIQKHNVTEVILALSATVEAQATCHVVMDHLENLNVKITRLAHGVPVGGELDYLDDGTIKAALRARG
jgi:recombination protein RecR